jgi:hypothetical protein
MTATTTAAANGASSTSLALSVSSFAAKSILRKRCNTIPALSADDVGGSANISLLLGTNIFSFSSTWACSCRCFVS